MKPLAITRVLVAILLIVIADLFVTKGGFQLQMVDDIESFRYTALSSGAVMLLFAVIFCSTKQQLIYFFGLIWLFFGAAGTMLFAATGREYIMAVVWINGLVVLDLMTVKMMFIAIEINIFEGT